MNLKDIVIKINNVLTTNMTTTLFKKIGDIYECVLTLNLYFKMKYKFK